MKNGGTIREKDGKFVWVGYYKDEKGVVHRPSKTFKSRKEAETYRELQAREPKHVENAKNKTDYTVEEFFKVWQRETVWSTEKYYKFTTTCNWQSLFPKHILPYIGNEKLQAIDYTKLQEHFNSTKLNRKTYINILKSIKSMIAFAKTYNEDLIIIDNLHKVKVLAEKNPREKVFNILSEENYNDISLYMLDNRLHYAHLISFLHETGLRIEEALGLTWSDISFKKCCVSVTKAIKRQDIRSLEEKETDANTRLILSEYLKSSGSNRLVPLNNVALRTLEAQRAMLKKGKIKSKFVFPTRTGKAADSRNVLRSFHNVIDMINRSRDKGDKIPKRGLHSLRKMCCKRLRDEAGFDWKIIAKFLGHTDEKVTINYYYSVSEDDMAKFAKQMNATDKRLEKERDLYLAEGADGDTEFEISDRDREDELRIYGKYFD